MPTDEDLEAKGRSIVEERGGHWFAGGGMCRCPAHDDRTPSLSVRLGRTRLLFHCFAGCATAAVLEALHTATLSLDRTARHLKERRSSPDLRAAALHLWHQGRVLDGTIGERYLAARGLPGVGGALRFHPAVPDGPFPLTRFRPALLAAVRDEHSLLAVHRTFLTPGIDPVPRADGRRALGSLGHGAVRLEPAGAILGLAEGIETALSVGVLFGIPCWAVLGAARFGRIAIPSDVSTLMLFLDQDPAGRAAETRARTAYGKRFTVIARYPAIEGQDWNDILLGSCRPHH